MVSGPTLSTAYPPQPVSVPSSVPPVPAPIPESVPVAPPPPAPAPTDQSVAFRGSNGTDRLQISQEALLASGGSPGSMSNTNSPGMSAMSVAGSAHPSTSGYRTKPIPKLNLTTEMGAGQFLDIQG